MMVIGPGTRVQSRIPADTSLELCFLFLSVSVLVSLSLSLSASVIVCLSLCLSVSVSLCVSYCVSLSLSLSVCPSASMPACLSVCVCINARVSVHSTRSVWRKPTAHRSRVSRADSVGTLNGRTATLVTSLPIFVNVFITAVINTNAATHSVRVERGKMTISHFGSMLLV